MHAERDIAMANLSVCLSVTRRYCIKTNAHIVKLFSDGGMTVVFYRLPPLPNSKGNSAVGGALNTRWVGKSAIFDRNRRLPRTRTD